MTTEQTLVHRHRYFATIMELRLTIVSGVNRSLTHKPEFFAEFQVGRVGRLQVIQEEQINVFEIAAVVQPPERICAVANDNSDNVPETCEIC